MTPSPDEGQVMETRARIRELVDAGNVGALVELVSDLHASDVADILESLEDRDARLALVRALALEQASEALAEMDDDEKRGELLAALEPKHGAELLQELADDDAADLIADLEPEEARAILAALPAADAGELRGLLRYDEETAGGRMTTELLSVGGALTAGEAIEVIRRKGREVDDFYTVFVVDEDDHLLGAVPLDDLIMASPETAVTEITEPFPMTILPEMDQEEVGRVFSRYNLVSVPVVDVTGRLLGRITFDDILDVMESEQTEDILLLAGVSADEDDLRADWRDAIKGRLPWLSLNLMTACLAASVILLFESILEEIWFLAAIMPIIAAMGGNSGTQALAVTVRRLAIGEGPLERKRDAVRTELVVGILNGIFLGILAAIVAYVGVLTIDGVSPMLPWVVLFAMWGTIVVAGFCGAFIPTVLDRIGIDPAIASSVFVTTLTDLFGFFLLLGLASALLL